MKINKKRDWVVTDLIHEKYTFDLETAIYKNKSILEILDDLGLEGLEDKIEKYNNREIYILDDVYHQDPDFDTWCLTKKEKSRFTPLHVRGLMLMPLEEFLKEGYLNASFGPTNRKYGVMDYAEVPVEMEETKNENQAIKADESTL